MFTFGVACKYRLKKKWIVDKQKPLVETCLHTHTQTVKLAYGRWAKLADIRGETYSMWTGHLEHQQLDGLHQSALFQQFTSGAVHFDFTWAKQDGQTK